MEQTLAIIKPDITSRCLIGKVISLIEEKNFKIDLMQLTKIDRKLAEEFYTEHRERSFFQDLLLSIAEKDVVVLFLSKYNAVMSFRELIGSTNPAEAAAGTIRKLYGQSVEKNSVHGSDSLLSAQREINLFKTHFHKR